jgi:hypothetical protein
MRQVRIYIALFAVAAIALLIVPRFHAADSLPNQIADDAFWKLIENFSEQGGAFQSENFLSNETGFEAVIPTLKQKTKPGGVYMGVGPEQNFTYIAAIHPKIAFIIDIRRQNMLEHMIYKALFEMSPNRVEFASRLFSRKRPAELNDKSSVDDIFDALVTGPIDNDGFKKTLQDVRDLLLKKHKFGLTDEDLANIEHVFTVFKDYGPEINYNSGSPRGGFGRGGRFGGGMPNYVDLMTATDQQGEERSYLAVEENYRTIRDMELKNLIVPLSGDFGGVKALRAVGQYARDHNATITAFYLSNVEQYLFQGNGNQNGGWKNFYDNCGTFPLDSTSTFIRSVGGMGRGMFGGGSGGRGFGGMRAPNVLSSMQETLAAVKSGRAQSYYDILSMSK